MTVISTMSDKILSPREMHELLTGVSWFPRRGARKGPFLLRREWNNIGHFFNLKNETKILFVCIHNSARSQMAEAFLNALGRTSGFIAESAGLEPGVLNPVVVEVMREKGIDISTKTTNDVFEFVKQGRHYHYLITVCDEASAEKCPIFPGVVERRRWSFPDPSSFKGTRDEKIQHTRMVRDQIENAVVEFLRVHANT